MKVLILYSVWENQVFIHKAYLPLKKDRELAEADKNMLDMVATEVEVFLEEVNICQPYDKEENE